MYTLVRNDAEFIQSDPNRGKIELPLGYPCVFSCMVLDKWIYSFIYVPSNIKCLQSFIAGVNAVC